MPETLVIGLGGVGAQVVRRLQARIDGEQGPGGESARAGRPPDLLVIDTDRTVAPHGTTGSLLLSTTAAVLDAAYRSPERFRAQWLNRDIIRGRTFHEQGAGGCRMLGRFLLLLPENLAAVRKRIGSWLSPSGRPQMDPNAVQRRRIYLVASTAGGAGGGQALDLAYLIQHLAAALGVQADLRALLFVPPAGDGRYAANSFSTLTELHYFSDPWTVYRAHLSDEEAPFETRRAPFQRVSLITSQTVDGDVIPLGELQERAAVYLMTATIGDDGTWEAERAAQESRVHLRDGDGNPQVFATFGTGWVEYPEERLASAVYRNLVRRSLTPWLGGDVAIGANELPVNVPLKDSEGLAALLSETPAGDAAPEPIIRPVKTRVPWIHRAPNQQWKVMDQELEAGLAAAMGKAPTAGRAGKGPMAERFQLLRSQSVSDLRGHAAGWLKRENVSLERIARILNETATDLRTFSDPVGPWEDARDAVHLAKSRVLWASQEARRDPFLLFWRRVALQGLAKEYETVATLYARNTLRAHALPFMRDLRNDVLEEIRTWAGRIGDLSGLFAVLSRSMADYESALLETLRKEDEADRLALGLLRLPGSETPYVANTGWNLPYCRPEDELAAIRDLKLGWTEYLVDRPDGLLADPLRSILDGPADQHREERQPWLMPGALPASDASGRMRQGVMHIDRELRERIEDRLRTWLSATAFQRMAEQFHSPVELEYQIRRLVQEAASLPALDPPHVRPSGFPQEYALVFFGDAKQAGEIPPVLGMVVDAASRERPTRVLPSLSPHYFTAITEHAGFSLARCPAYHHLLDGYREWVKTAGEKAVLPYNRADVPWLSATLTTRRRLRDAADVLFMAMALGVLHPGSKGDIPLPSSIVPGDANEWRFPLPTEFDLAVRQLAGDEKALMGVSQAVDRAVQGKGVEWCTLQVERAVTGDAPITLKFPGADTPQQMRAGRLAALRAGARCEELLQEYGRTGTFRDTDWMKAGGTYFCPACGTNLGEDAEALPGLCPACRQPLLPHRMQGFTAADGFRRIPNPFVVGTPLETGSSVFVGREDIIQTVRDRLIRPASRTILILIGERRCGKTSALKQLQYRLEADLTPLFIDMQGLTASDLPGFLWWLSWRMKESLEDRGIRVDLPNWDDFGARPPDYQFETVILPAVRRALNGGRVLLMLDEFEVLAQRVMNGAFDGRAFDYIRHLMQHGEGIEFLFAGTHVLRSFAANYVTFLFNIGVFLNVDFLRPRDALRLIQEPLAAPGVTFTDDALAAVLDLAGAHAYFTQMFGFHLVERLNRLRKRNVTREDVEAEAGPVIAAAGAHLDHVWGQLAGADRLLIAFFADQCPRGKKIQEDDLLSAAIRNDGSLRPFVFRTAVEKLAAVGLLRQSTDTTPDGRTVRNLSITAEVYRQWLQTTHGYTRLRDEGLTWE